MGITFIGSASASAIDGGDPSITLPSGMQQDDLVIVAGAIGDNDNVDFVMSMVTTGYSTFFDIFANDAQDCNLGLFYKFMGATPDTTAVFNGQGGADAACAAIAMVFRGLDTAYAADYTFTTGINTMHPNPPNISWSKVGAWTLIVGASGHTLGGTGTYTFPAGYTTNAVNQGSNDSNDITVGMGYKILPVSPEDPGVMTHSGGDSANYAWCAATLSLYPLTVEQPYHPWPHRGPILAQ